MSVQTPLMNLVQPTIGVDSGLTWEQSMNANSSILDQHNHSAGSGAQINPSGININADLPFNGNNAISLRSVRFSIQDSPLVLASDIGCIYVSGVDLYYNDVDGNQIQITAGGSVNATSSGISDGTATASFSSNVLVVNSASNTPANIQGASYIMGNTGVSGSKYLTLSPPSALAANYSITFPLLPAQTNVMTLGATGNIASVTWDAVGQNMTATGANAIIQQVTQPQIFGGEAIVIGRTNANTPMIMIRGLVSSVGGIISGQGYSSGRILTGQYVIHFNVGFVDNPAVIVTVLDSILVVATTANNSAGGIDIKLVNAGSLNFVDAAFSFIAVGTSNII